MTSGQLDDFGRDAVEIRRLRRGDEQSVLAAGSLFDDAPDASTARRFLEQPNHHLLIAYATGGGGPLGFVSGVETTHPDKGSEMFLYELAVDESARRRGVGRSLVEALVALARSRGCYAVWVLTDTDNVAALATYEGAGGTRTVAPQVMLEWELGERDPG